MSVNEIAYVDPALMLLDEGVVTIPVGTLAVIPHYPLDKYAEEFEKKGDEDFVPEIPPLPSHTILACGQTLRRADYLELSPIVPDGGFYDFTLPNLTRRFILGINADTGEIMWGDGIIYFESVPKPPSLAQPQIVNDR